MTKSISKIKFIFHSFLCFFFCIAPTKRKTAWFMFQCYFYCFYLVFGFADKEKKNCQIERGKKISPPDEYKQSKRTVLDRIEDVKNKIRKIRPTEWEETKIEVLSKRQRQWIRPKCTLNTVLQGDIEWWKFTILKHQITKNHIFSD